VDYDVGSKLNRQASTSCYVHVRASSVQGLETADDQLLFQLNQHSCWKMIHSGLVLYGAPPQCPWVREPEKHQEIIDEK
jgi:hypothetical protein